MKKQSKQESEKISSEKIRNVALRMIARRDFCLNELSGKLTKKFPENITEIKDIVNELSSRNLVSDQRYASEFIRFKSEYNGWGPFKIKEKLKEKGVSTDIISQELAEAFCKERKLELARKLAKEKWNLLHKKKATERTAAVQRFMASRGFNFSIILEVTKDLAHHD